MKHAPGPWAVKADKNFKSLAEIVSIDGPVLDEGFALSSEKEMANARLIAAAPELLEALKDCVQHLTCLDASRDSLSVAERVIAKAEGRSL